MAVDGWLDRARRLINGARGIRQGLLGCGEGVCGQGVSNFKSTDGKRWAVARGQALPWRRSSRPRSCDLLDPVGSLLADVVGAPAGGERFGSLGRARGSGVS